MNITVNLSLITFLEERNHEYNTSGAGSFVLEFKFQDKKWALDATIEDGSFGHLINHSKKFQNVKPIVLNLKGKPSDFFYSNKRHKDEELLFDYGHNSSFLTMLIVILKHHSNATICEVL